MSTSNVETTHGAIAIAQTSGAGTPILFIHGNSSCKEVFRNQLLGDIGKTFHCVAMDLPGHGQSENARDSERTYTMSGYADCALQVMDALGIDSFAVVGWSLGGHIGIEMLAQSDRVRALLISGTPPVSNNPADFALAFLPSEHMGLTGQEVFTEAEAEAYARTTCGDTATYEAFLGDAVRRTDGRARRIMMETAIRGEGADQRRQVETDPRPLAIVNGTDEPFVNNAYLETIAYKNLWENKVHLISNTGHAPFWDAPAEFDAHLRRFILRLDECVD